MTIQETAQIMDILTVAYPGFYRGQSSDEQRKAVKLWATMFADDPAGLVAAAVKALIVTDVKGFPPHIGAVKEQIAKMREGEGGQMTELEAWALVRKALSNGNYGYKEEYAKLPPEIQSVLGDAKQLRDWAQADIGDVDTVIASNFQRSYRARAAHVREFAKLPPSVKDFSRQLAESLSMDRKLALEVGSDG